MNEGEDEEGRMVVSTIHDLLISRLCKTRSHDIRADASRNYLLLAEGHDGSSTDTIYTKIINANNVEPGLHVTVHKYVHLISNVVIESRRSTSEEPLPFVVV
jgi:hypothetical protein